MLKSLVSPSVSFRGALVLLFLYSYIFHSASGILEAGQLAGFLGCQETWMTLLGAILAKLKLETYTVTLLISEYTFHIALM